MFKTTKKKKIVFLVVMVPN